MWNNSDNSGLFGLLFGIVMLVLLTVTMGTLTDKRLGVSSRAKEFNAEIRHNDGFIKDLQNSLATRQELVKAADEKRARSSADSRDITRTLEDSSIMVKDMREKVPALRATIAKLEKEFTAYRQQYRSQIWAKAIGEKHPSITTVTGKVYEDVTIRNVTDVGLNVAHKAGMSRIDAIALDPSWKERFQWNDAERRAQLIKERDKQIAHAHSQQTKPTALEPLSKNQQIEKARTHYLLTRARYLKLRTDIHNAEYQQATQKGRSMPGSLKTWDEHLTALRPQMVKAQEIHNAATTELRTLSPGDSLLRQRDSETEIP